MLKAFHLGIIFAVVLALFAFILARPLHFDIVLPRNSEFESFLADEGTVRSERSADISHIIGISRKIQLIVNKVMFLQISPDGTVSGTDDDNDYTIFQRVSVNNRQIKIQSIVTCNFLCIDRCGLLYGSKEFTDECIFNETMESHHFNTYSSAKYSNEKRTLYLALNKKGIPRKVQTKAKASLGKLEMYTNVLPKPVSPEKVESLAIQIAKSRIPLGSAEFSLTGHHPVRHHRFQFCPNVPMTKSDDKNKFPCRKREKRKKKKKNKEDEDEDDGFQPAKKKLGKCEEDEDEEECLKRLHMVRQKRKSLNGESDVTKSVTCVKCMNDKGKRRKGGDDGRRKKFSENFFKSKCDGEGNCFKRKGAGKSHRGKKKTRTSSAEEPATASLLWKDSLDHGRPTDTEDKIQGSTTVTMSEKTGDDYEEDEATEKFTEDDEEDLSTEVTYDWTTPSSSNRD